MTAEERLYTLLTEDAAVNAVVAGRVYPVRMPEAEGATLPAIVYTRISGGQVSSVRGGSGLENPRVQVDCWATTYAGAKGLATAVREAMDGGGAEGLKSVLLAHMDMVDDETGDYRVSMDFSVWHRLT